MTHGGQGWDLLRASDQPGSQALQAPGPSSRSPPSKPQQLHPLSTDRPGASFPKLLHGALGSLKGSGTEAGGSHPVASEPHLQEQVSPTPQPPCPFSTTSGYLPLILALTTSPPKPLPSRLLYSTRGHPTTSPDPSKFSFHDEGRLEADRRTSLCRAQGLGTGGITHTTGPSGDQRPVS